ncbi:arginine--tRNA ligase, cytoplasmic [Rosa chinensis]|nr:arginine--tRNA ligase, cytoplasmic [Rosa chinensis]XP_024161573.1 arginine--tRNA ligase, cytoplasmic [Rosa chinensis]XP_024161574.1 arginine--tRNA ligase, cytoplasmic [Rosa chinensis]XP_024161575.1 arginine--tRNA ligase, cytoplasmic [Rosa chinensis]XP_024161576.1 arginine--tRNA ligase, cytoplasmic [Rosa chinensis]XP_024161577.1 arginine--tRNA ligase, cytoplasmic [Rosa chinensis]XP_024161578.1 arginine--tRNA ligase, cytoplasmic [Rosa chinensis]XP_024161579.1 arginine--tRNA ligase, cytoplas
MIEGFNHILTDLTALWYRLKVEKAEWIIYITIEQKQQKSNVMKLAGTAGWLPTECGSFKTLPKASHIGVGLVPGSDTVKAFKLFDLLDEAKSAARRHLMKCGDGRGNKWDEDSLEKLAETIGCAAAKYVYLQDDRRGNDKSDFVRMLNDREINVYFLDHGSFCYTWRHYKEVENDDIVLDEDLECELGSHLLKFAETVMTACKSVKPSLLCGYLSRLIQIFKTFSDDFKARKVFIFRNLELWRRKTLLCEAASSIMRRCFDLLGVPDPLLLCSEESDKSAGK